MRVGRIKLILIMPKFWHSKKRIQGYSYKGGTWIILPLKNQEGLWFHILPLQHRQQGARGAIMLCGPILLLPIWGPVKPFLYYGIRMVLDLFVLVLYCCLKEGLWTHFCITAAVSNLTPRQSIPPVWLSSASLWRPTARPLGRIMPAGSPSHGRGLPAHWQCTSPQVNDGKG